MTRALIALALSLTAGPGRGGPNQGGMLALHTDPQVAGTDGNPGRAIRTPSSCGEFVSTGRSGGSDPQWFLVVAVFAQGSSPELSTFVFGLGDDDPSSTYIVAYGSVVPRGANDLEISASGCTLPRSGTAVSFSPSCVERERIVPIYHFGVYAYLDDTIPLRRHPTQGAGFVNCGPGGETDEIRDFGVMGFGSASGSNPCEDERIRREETTWSEIKWGYR